MVSFLFAGIPPSVAIDTRIVMPELLTQEPCERGQVAAFKSEWWPASTRKTWPDWIGICTSHSRLTWLSHDGYSVKRVDLLPAAL